MINTDKKKRDYKQYVIHRDKTENKTETNQDTLNKVREELPDYLYDEQKENTTENENEGVIHRDMNENEIATHRDTLKRVSEECPYGISSVVMKEYVNNELILKKNRI